MNHIATAALASNLLLLGTMGLARAAETQARNDLDSPAAGPFPSDWFTVPDSRHRTGRRVALPKPDCSTYPSECLDIDTVNERDGFNIQPRLSIPFSGPIDLSTATSANIFLLELAEAPRAWPPGSAAPPAPPALRIIGINQRIWDPETHTLHAESDSQLRQYTTYALVVTNGVRDPSGKPVRASPQFTALLMQAGRLATSSYGKRALGAARSALATRHGPGEQVVALSVFTTMSVTPILEKIRTQVRSAPPPAPADFHLGSNGERSIFAVGGLSYVRHWRQNSVAGPLTAMGCQLGGTGTLAFGRFRAPSFLAPERYIPTTGTAPSAAPPAVQGEFDIHFILHLPAGPAPAGGWPVVIFGHGYGSNMLLSCAVQREFTGSGMAVVAFNVIGHGGGPAGLVDVGMKDGSSVRFPLPGRGEDRDGDGTIDGAEGMSAEGTWRLLVMSDGNRQAVAELVQLVRILESGVDLDGDGTRDLDPSRIYFIGHSNGGAYGAMLAAVEPVVRAVALAAPGAGPAANRMSLVWRPTYRERFGARQPSLLNVAGGTDFDENIPLRDQPVAVNAVAGAMKLQEFFEHEEWAREIGSSPAYAPYLTSSPLGCQGCCPYTAVPSRCASLCGSCGHRTPTLLQFVKGDEYVANPATSALVRAGALGDVTTYLRWDLLSTKTGTPHNFILNMPAARQQVAEFFASDGQSITDPDGSGPAWETPIQPPLPEVTNY